MKKLLLMISLCVVPLSAMQNGEAPRGSGETLMEQWERKFKAQCGPGEGEAFQQRLKGSADSSDADLDQKAPAVKLSPSSGRRCFCCVRRSGQR